MTAAEIAAALHARPAGGGWLARCPAHDDRSPSLSVRDGRDGRVLLHCWAGCATGDVLAAAGLAGADMCGRPRTRAEAAADRQRRAGAQRRRDALAAEARAIADRIRRLGRVEIGAVDRVRDLRAGAPERWPGEMWFGAQAAAESAGEVARLTAQHDAVLDRLYSRVARGAAAERRAA